MKNRYSVILILLISSWPVSPLFAADCNAFKPTFTVDGEEQWKGQSPDVIVKLYHKDTGANELYKKKLLVRELIRPYGKNGVLVLSICNGKSKSYDVVDILSDTSDENSLALMLARKDFFKLISTKSTKPILKKVSGVQLILD